MISEIKVDGDGEKGPIVWKPRSRDVSPLDFSLF